MMLTPQVAMAVVVLVVMTHRHKCAMAVAVAELPIFASEVLRLLTESLWPAVVAEVPTVLQVEMEGGSLLPAVVATALHMEVLAEHNHKEAAHSRHLVDRLPVRWVLVDLQVIRTPGVQQVAEADTTAVVLELLLKTTVRDTPPEVVVGPHTRTQPMPQTLCTRKAMLPPLAMVLSQSPT
jgi:hypothetical protein